MSTRILRRVAAGVFAAALAMSSPAFARGGGGGMMMGGGGGMHGGGGMSGGHAMGGMGGGMHAMGGPHMAAMGVGGPHFSSGHFTHAAFSPRFGFHHRFHHGFFFVGAPFFYAGYDSCWNRVWTAYGLRWVNVRVRKGRWRPSHFRPACTG
jgi:hypothetical protein